MIDPNHLFTIHKTYTGPGCAICSEEPEVHLNKEWLVEGVKTQPRYLKYVLDKLK